MARTAGTPAALFGVPVFSANCATHAVDVICRICAQLSPSRSASGAFVCAGLACAKLTDASTSEISNAHDNFILADPPAVLLRTCKAHLEEIEFLFETPQHFIINFIVIAHIEQGRALQCADILRELAITNIIFGCVAGLDGAVTRQQIQMMFLDSNQVLV